jgi:hypothetical protein
VFAKGPGSEIEQLRGDLHGRWRQATRAVMVLPSQHADPGFQEADSRSRSGSARPALVKIRRRG